MLTEDPCCSPEVQGLGPSKLTVNEGHILCRWEVSNLSARLDNLLLEPESIDVLYMDNTYCEPRQAQTVWSPLLDHQVRIVWKPQLCSVLHIGSSAPGVQLEGGRHSF